MYVLGLKPEPRTRDCSRRVKVMKGVRVSR